MDASEAIAEAFDECKLSKNDLAQPEFTYPQAEMHTILATCQRWLKGAQNAISQPGTKRNLTDVKRQHAQICPPELYSNNPEHTFMREPQLLHGLERADFNFLTQTKGSKTEGARIRFVNAVHLEITCDDRFLHPVFLDYPLLYVFRHRLRILITQASRNASWRNWE